MTVIAMTREMGSRGVEVAERLASKLGLKIIRSEMVADSVAKRLGIDAQAFLRYMDGTASLLERWRIDRHKLVHYTTEEILRLAQEGNVLIKGWGAATLMYRRPLVCGCVHPWTFVCELSWTGSEFKDANAVRQQIERYDAARVATLVRERADALFVAGDGFLNSRRLQLATFATRHGIPTVYSGRDTVDVGGLMSYATDNVEVHRLAGDYSGRILKGAKPSDLPVIQSTKFEFVINLITAGALGLTVPGDLLSIADEVIV